MKYQDAKLTFQKHYSENDDLIRSGEGFFKSLVESIIADSGIKIHQVISRVKTRESCLDKFDKKYRQKFEQSQREYAIKESIKDLIGVRIVCFYEDDVRKVADLLEKTLASVEERKDRYSERDDSPNEFGYRAIHLVLKLSDNRRELAEYRRFSELMFEVQIRTVIQDAWSVLDHKLQYKGHAPPKLKRAINALAAVFEQADEKFLQIRSKVEDEQNDAKKLVVQVEHSQPSTQSTPASSTTPLDSASSNTVHRAIDVISLNELVKAKFPEFAGTLPGVSRLLDDLGSIANDLTLEQIAGAVSSNLDNLNAYERDSKNISKLSPLTKLRHCLYLQDKETYREALFDYQRHNFDEWLEIQRNTLNQYSLHTGTSAVPLASLKH
jgi:putative GTP pyrophosphokinase